MNSCSAGSHVSAIERLKPFGRLSDYASPMVIGRSVTMRMMRPVGVWNCFT